MIQRSLIITGTQVNYYFVCKRKLWLFSHDLEMEDTSDLVLLGKLIHEESYSREKKEIELEGIKLDFFERKNGIIHEIKKSDKVEEAHSWQLLYYLYHLKKYGVEGVTGEIDYPLLKKRVEVVLTEELEGKMEEVLKDIGTIIRQETPPPLFADKRFCKKCSYYELCYT
jgi:CRISPR-associated exonuclease Cas4